MPKEKVIRAPSESELAAAARPAGSPSRLAHALWYGRSVRAQLLIVFVLIDIVAAVVAGGVTILKARTATRVEIAASMELAQLFTREAVGLMQQEVPAEKFLADLSSQLRLVRHVRIGVKDAAGRPLALGGNGPPREDRAAAPRWFAALIAAPVTGRTVPVIVNGRTRRRGASDETGRTGLQPIVAPMPGRVVRVLVSPGDDVAARQGVVVVEAMKMENELRSPKAGKVKEVNVTPGTSVEAGRVLVVIE